MLSPQPTKAVQTCKTIFLFANEEHGRLKQMYGYNIIGGKRINYIAAQCTGHCAALVL
jgi:hypothetical protein